MATKPPNGIYTFSGRPGSSYKYENNQWFVSNSGTKNQYVPMQDPTGNRAKTLEAGLKSGKTQFTQGLGAVQKYPNGGGMKTVKSKDGTITNKFTNKEGNTVIQVKTKDGRYYEKVVEPQIKPLDNTSRYQNALLNNPAIVADNTRVIQDNGLPKDIQEVIRRQEAAQRAFEESRRDEIKAAPEYSTLDKIGNIVRNPLVAASYAMQPGDFAMPMNYSEFERSPNYQDDVWDNNLVGRGLNAASYFHPVSMAAHAIDNAIYTGKDLRKAINSGEASDWKQAGISALNTGLDLVGGSFIGKSGRLFNTGEKVVTDAMRINNKLGVSPQINNYLGNKVFPIVSNSNISSADNILASRVFPSINPNNINYRPLSRSLYNDAVIGAKINNFDNALENLTTTNNNFDLEQLRRVYHNRERFLTPDERSYLHNNDYGVLENYRTPTSIWDRIPELDNSILENIINIGNKNNLLRYPRLNEINTYDINPTTSRVRVWNTKDDALTNRSGLTKEDVLKTASPKDKDIISKMSEEDFKNTVLKPTGEVVSYQDDINLMPHFTGNNNVFAIPEEEYTDLFNERLDLLNDIIAQNNKSGFQYGVKGLKNNTLTFYHPEQTVNGVTIPQGNTTWSVKVNPGQWRGNVEDINNKTYFRSIPGLEMSNTSSGVFSDGMPRKGTGAYESINEYLKKLDLGRIKPGFNSQTDSSKGAWENFIKSGRAVGYYNNPRVLYGVMKAEGGKLNEWPPKKSPILYVTNPKDPRLIAYNDRLNAYNKTQNVFKALNNLPTDYSGQNFTNKHRIYTAADDELYKFMNTHPNIKPRYFVNTYDYLKLDGPKAFALRIGIPVFEKPVQQVIYKKPELEVIPTFLPPTNVEDGFEPPAIVGENVTSDYKIPDDFFPPSPIANEIPITTPIPKFVDSKRYDSNLKKWVVEPMILENSKEAQYNKEREDWKEKNKFKQGGSLAKNIPTYYNYSGTPIYRDTTALPFPDGGYLSLQNAMLGPLPEREKPNSVLAYNKFVEATKTPNESAYIRPSYSPESNHYKYGFLGAGSGNIYGGAGYGVPKYGLEANVFGSLPAQSDPYYKGFYSAELAKQFGNNQVGLGVSSPVVGYTDDSGFHMDRLELTPQLSFRKNFAEGGPLETDPKPKPKSVTVTDSRDKRIDEYHKDNTTVYIPFKRKKSTEELPSQFTIPLDALQDSFEPPAIVGEENKSEFKIPDDFFESSPIANEVPTIVPEFVDTKRYSIKLKKWVPYSMTVKGSIEEQRDKERWEWAKKNIENPANTSYKFADGGPLNDKTNHGKILNSIYASALGDYYASGGMLKRADGSYSRRGLWDNIRAAAARNKAQGKPGKAPTKEMLEQAKVSSKANGGFVAGRQMYQPLDIRESYGGFLYGNGGQFPTTFSLPEDSFKQGGNNLHDSVYASSMAQYPAVYAMGGNINVIAGGEKHRVYIKESPTGMGEGVKGHVMVNHPTMDKGQWDTIDLTKKAGAKTVKQGIAATKKWHRENPQTYSMGGSILSMSNTPELSGEGKDLSVPENAYIYGAGGSIKKFKKR